MLILCQKAWFIKNLSNSSPSTKQSTDNVMIHESESRRQKGTNGRTAVLQLHNNMPVITRLHDRAAATTERL